MAASHAASVVIFDGDLTILNCDERRSQLISALSMGGDVALDCTAAADVDLSFIQLLLGARVSARSRGIRLSVVAPAQGALMAALVAAGVLPDEEQARNQFCAGDG